MNKSFISFLLPTVLCVATILTSCSKDTKQIDKTTEAEPKEPIIIRTTIKTNELSEAQIKEFQDENPNIKIEIVSSDDTKLMAMIASGIGPDLIRISGAMELPNYVIRGLALNIDGYIEKSTVIKKEDLLPVANVYRWDGESQGVGPLYGLPKDWSLDNTLFINKKIFKEFGISLPDPKKPMTFSEITNLAKKLYKKEGDNTIIYGYDGELFSLPFVQTMLTMEGKSLWSSDFKKATVNNVDVKSILQAHTEFIISGAPTSPLNPPKDWFGSNFVSDKIAILKAGYWFSGFLRSDDKSKNRLEDFMMLPAATSDSGKRLSPSLSATGAVIFKETKHPEEAFKFFEYYFGGKPVEDRVKSGWGLPIYRSKLSLVPQASDFDKQCHGVIIDEINNAKDIVIQFNPYINSNKAYDLFDKIITPVYFGKETADSALQKLEIEIQNMIEKEMEHDGLTKM
jgi:multiple sugar transport system substrate-binding protein